MRKGGKRFALAALLLLAAGFLFLKFGKPIWEPIYLRLMGLRTIPGLLKEVTPRVEGRLKPFFQEAGISYPPRKISLLAFKKEKMLELWCEKEGKWRYVRTYPVLAASGKAGPKCQAGDCQVPEGFYGILAINPNSTFHIAMLLDYPNELDRRNASSDGRSNLGGDICIHGGAASIGCLAIGDPAIEELFVLVALAGVKSAKVIIAPNDLRTSEPEDEGQMRIPWVPGLYDVIGNELRDYPPPIQKP